MVAEAGSLKLTVSGAVATLEFHHGKANEVGRQQLDALDALNERLEAGEIRALISYSRRVSSTGKPIFISGANVTERVGWSDDQIKEHVRYQRRVLTRLRQTPVFHVAVVNGIAFGWGTEFLLTADYRIAAPWARLALPETGLGILPGAGGSSELAQQIGLAHTLRLGMTGEAIGAEEAHRIGLVQELAGSVEAGLERAEALAAMVARRSPTAVAAFKAAVLGGVGACGQERQELEARAYEHCVNSGEAAIGRQNFGAITSGEAVAWGAYRPFRQ